MTNVIQSHIPKLRLHKTTSQGYVEIEGRSFYLGRYGRPETQERYHRFISEWLANGRCLRVDPNEIAIAELVNQYLKWATGYYVNADGAPSTQLGLIKRAVKPLVLLYGRTRAADFGPVAARAIRQTWIDEGLARKTINGYATTLKSVFKWGASHELIPASVHHGLLALEGLRRGRSNARETRPITPVLEAHINAVRPLVSRQVRAMIDLQLLTAARPGELCVLRPIDFDRRGRVWLANVPRHKNEWREKDRVLYVGPKAQEIIRQFLDRPIHSCLFSPKEAESERYAACREHRHQPAEAPATDRRLGDGYTTDSYRRAINYGCEKAGVPSWSPHRLRHNAATEIRRQFGLEIAQIMLGHARADVTEIYAEVNAAKAISIAEQIG
jgi:integrase